jgi:hypothetical protein
MSCVWCYGGDDEACESATCNSCDRVGCYECIDEETGNCRQCDCLADAFAEEDEDAYDTDESESDTEDDKLTLWQTICQDIEEHKFH